MKSNELFRLLQQAGWFVSIQGKGSHKKLSHPDKPGITIIFPDHGSKEFAKGLANKIFKQAGLK